MSRLERSDEYDGNYRGSVDDFQEAAERFEQRDGLLTKEEKKPLTLEQQIYEARGEIKALREELEEVREERERGLLAPKGLMERLAKKIAEAEQKLARLQDEEAR